MNAISVAEVTKRFGRAQALAGMSFTVPFGTVCGLIGPNGAGKTTILSIIAGFLRPDAGRVDLLGLGPFDPEAHRGRVGILPQDAELPLASTPRQILRVWARLGGVADADAAVERALEAVLLRERGDARIGTLSHGMRRRVTVASAILGEPELVMLDEPTSGLDPSQARHLRDQLAAGRGRRTVFVSSHNLAELESICDHVVFVEAGRCVREGALTTVTGRDRRARIHLVPPFPAGRTAEVDVVLGPEDPRSLEQVITDTLRTLIGEGAVIAEVVRGASLERAYFEEGGR